MPSQDGAVMHLAGYQGEGSILTAALTRLADTLRELAPDWLVHQQSNVPAAGETAQSLFASVELGHRQLCYMASGYLSARVPELEMLDLPFAVNDRTAALAALDGAAGQWLRQAVAQQTGYQVLAFWDNGFRHISNSVRPIRSPSDCQGLVIRTLDSAVYREALSSLGFSARSIDVKDLVRVVQSGEVQAQENPLTNLLSFSLWRHHPFVSLSGHFFGVLLVLCSRSWYDSLDSSRQQALLGAVEVATQQQRQAAAAEDARALAQLQDLGVQVLKPEVLDLAAMKLATAAVRQAHSQALPSELLRAYLG